MTTMIIDPRLEQRLRAEVLTDQGTGQLTSRVLPLVFTLAAGPQRPRIVVRRADDTRSWVV